MDFDEIVNHTGGDDCAVCRAQDVAHAALIPAVSAWELSHNLPRFSLALHGAVGLLGAMLEEGADREALEDAVSQMLDEIERQIEEDKILGGPPQGSA